MSSERSKSCCFFHSFERFNYFRAFSNQFRFLRSINRDSTALYLAILTIIFHDVLFSGLRQLKHHDRSLIADMHTIRKDTSAKNEFRVWMFAVAI